MRFWLLAGLYEIFLLHYSRCVPTVSRPWDFSSGIIAVLVFSKISFWGEVLSLRTEEPQRTSGSPLSCCTHRMSKGCFYFRTEWWNIDFLWDIFVFFTLGHEFFSSRVALSVLGKTRTIFGRSWAMELRHSQYRFCKKVVYLDISIAAHVALRAYVRHRTN